MRIKLGQYLVQKGLVRPQDVEEALAVQANSGGLIGQIMVRLGSLSEPDLLNAVSESLGLPLQPSAEMPTPEVVRAFITESQTNHAWWVSRDAIAWRAVAGETEVVMCVATNPLDPLLRGLLSHTTDQPISYRLAPRSMIQAALGRPDRTPGPSRGRTSGRAAVEGARARSPGHRLRQQHLRRSVAEARVGYPRRAI